MVHSFWRRGLTQLLIPADSAPAPNVIHILIAGGQQPKQAILFLFVWIVDGG
jgi:hypothetical protein